MTSAITRVQQLSSKHTRVTFSSSGLREQGLKEWKLLPPRKRAPCTQRSPGSEHRSVGSLPVSSCSSILKHADFMDTSRTRMHPSSHARITLSDMHQSTSSIRKVTFLPLRKLLTICTFRSEFGRHSQREKKTFTTLISQRKTVHGKGQCKVETQQSLAIRLSSARRQCFKGPKGSDNIKKTC